MSKSSRNSNQKNGADDEQSRELDISEKSLNTTQQKQSTEKSKVQLKPSLTPVYTWDLRLSGLRNIR